MRRPATEDNCFFPLNVHSARPRIHEIRHPEDLLLRPQTSVSTGAEDAHLLGRRQESPQPCGSRINAVCGAAASFSASRRVIHGHRGNRRPNPTTGRVAGLPGVGNYGRLQSAYASEARSGDRPDAPPSGASPAFERRAASVRVCRMSRPTASNLTSPSRGDDQS